MSKRSEASATDSAPGNNATRVGEDADVQLERFEQMLFIRCIEERVAEIVRSKVVSGTSLHGCMGQEANSVAVGRARGQGDVMFSSHRAFAHCIGWGADPVATLAETLGRRGGFASGLAGHMHLVDVESRVLGTNGIVGGGLPLAVGASIGLSTLEPDAVVFAFFGDGAVNTGAWHESLNLAAVWGLPILFFCENNGFAEMTYSANTSAGQLVDHGKAYGIDTERVNGGDIRQVSAAVERATSGIRHGNGPALIESLTLRVDGHWIGDSQWYRDDSLLPDHATDPILGEREAILADGTGPEALESLEARTAQRAQGLVDEVLGMEEAQPADLDLWKRIAG